MESATTVCLCICFKVAVLSIVLFYTSLNSIFDQCDIASPGLNLLPDNQLVFRLANASLDLIHTVILVDEEENEELEEEELDIEGDLVEHDSSNPWDLMYVDNDPDGDMDADDTTEDTALLRTQAAKTEIIVTPISPVRCGIFRKKALMQF